MCPDFNIRSRGPIVFYTEYMFFRRAKVHENSFAEYLDRARKAGFAVAESGGRASVSRNGVAAVLENVAGTHPRIAERAGREMNGEIATLVDGGYQKFLQTPSGVKRPALAADLKAIHEFQEDLREAMDIPSLYNESLGTVSNQYIYDRVEERDQASPKAPWKIKTQ